MSTRVLMRARIFSQTSLGGSRWESLVACSMSVPSCLTAYILRSKYYSLHKAFYKKQHQNQIILLLMLNQVSPNSQQFYNITFPAMHRTYFDNTSQFGVNNTLVDQLVSALQHNEDRMAFENELQYIDRQLYETYAAENYRTNPISKELYQPPQAKISKLEIPKENSLTDSLMRNTLGCEQRLAKSYIEIVDRTEHKESEQRTKRIELAKKKFAENNSHKDFTANTKPFMNNVRFALQRPVIDNEHESYLKTQLIFLQQPKGPTTNTKEYFDKHTQVIAKKINELGGMQDTIGKMQDSLSKNEVKSFKKKQVLAGMNQEKKYLFSPPKTMTKAESGKLRDSWINRSREMRESFMAKFQIE